jgi:hypothetical protein
MESVRVQDVIDSETSSLGTNLFKCRTVRICRSSVAGLKEVYSVYEAPCKVMVQEDNQKGIA